MAENSAIKWYTTDLAFAGIYARSQGEKIVDGSHPEKQLELRDVLNVQIIEVTRAN